MRSMRICAAHMEDESERQTTALLAQADALRAAGRYEDAIACYQRAIAQAPGALGVHRLVVGELLFELQRYGEAARVFEEFVAAMPSHPQGWDALGRTYAMTGAYERAAWALERAIALAPAWAEALWHAALAYAELGMRAEAEDRLRRAIAIDPRFADAARDEGLID